ncbi:CD209 antigen-like [Ylistrum balloti]|uniref:CD209 antigen-like n=1 Tax=Ylistrum balloti TaxID=509963 RepID=UPI002905F0F2|nr:CD209 antigen-like [Ylistrum balloti]
MATRLLLLCCIGFIFIACVDGQPPLGSQSQYAVLRTYAVDLVSPLAAATGALFAQHQIETDDKTFKPETVPTSTLPNGENGCPTGWHLYNGFCYVVTSNQRNWLRTRENCMNMGGYLADFVDQAEFNNIRDNVLQPFPGRLVYFGLNDHIEEGNFINDIVNEEPRFLNFVAGPLAFGPGPGDCAVVGGNAITTIPCVRSNFGLCKRRQNSVLTYTGL